MSVSLPVEVKGKPQKGQTKERINQHSLISQPTPYSLFISPKSAEGSFCFDFAAAALSFIHSQSYVVQVKLSAREEKFEGETPPRRQRREGRQRN